MKTEPEYIVAPTATYKWGAFQVASHETPKACDRWFKTRTKAVTYARSTVWRKWAIARAFL